MNAHIAMCTCGNPMCTGVHTTMPDPRLAMSSQTAISARETLERSDIPMEVKQRALNDLISAFMSAADVAIDHGQELLKQQEEM